MKRLLIHSISLVCLFIVLPAHTQLSVGQHIELKVTDNGCLACTIAWLNVDVVSNQN